jgi:hypothetical protein
VEPLVKILEALSALRAGQQLRARTDRRPMLLYPQVEERNFTAETNEQPDGSFITQIPPYGVKFGSNFQPFVRKRDVSHGDDEDLTEYVSYEDALKYAPIEVSGISGTTATAMSSDAVPTPAITVEGTRNEMDSENVQLSVTDFQSEDVLVIQQNTTLQMETIESMDIVEVNTCNPILATEGLGDSAAVTEVNPMMDLDEFNKEIEEARLLRFEQLQQLLATVSELAT